MYNVLSIIENTKIADLTNYYSCITLKLIIINNFKKYARSSKHFIT